MALLPPLVDVVCYPPLVSDEGRLHDVWAGGI